MLRDDRRLLPLSCPNLVGLACPRTDCPGMTDPAVCRHLSALNTCRSQTFEEQLAGCWGGDEPEFSPSREPARGRIRLGFWSPCLGQGGAEAWQLSLARAVDAERFVWSGTAVIEGRRSADPVMVGELSRLMPVGYGLEAARTLASSCDVILSWAVVNVGKLLDGLERPPEVVMACHFPAEASWGYGTLELLSGVSRYVAVSELAVESIPHELRGQVEVIWNAVDARRLAIHRDRARMRANWGCPADALVAGYLGRLALEKDPQAMLRLASELPEPWHVVIVGDGREKAALTRQILDQGLTHVHLVGNDPSAGDVLNAFDTLVVPSLYESFGLTLAEGLWAGLPVVATHCGLAKLVPGLVHEVSLGASGEELATAVLADRADLSGTIIRVLEARDFARKRLGLDRFGRSWSEFLRRCRSKPERRNEPCRLVSRLA